MVLLRFQIAAREGWPQLIALGQFLSILLTGTGTFSQLLANHGVNVPTFQSFINYLLLAIVFGGAWLRLGIPLQVSWWKYALLALADVEGNFCLVMAFQYTTITSVQILDCFTIPCVMVLSLIFLRINYTHRHYLGVFLCLVGLAVLVATDFYGGRNDSDYEQSHPNKVFGDLLVLLGCVCYSISNFGQERIVQTYSKVEFLAFLGIWGSIISGVQMLLIERQKIAAFPWGSAVAWGYLSGFTCCLFSLYVIVPEILKKTSAVFLNLSFLTADFWSVMVGIFMFETVLYGTYFIALFMTLLGLVIWNLAERRQAGRHQKVHDREQEAGGGGGAINAETTSGRTDQDQSLLAPDLPDSSA